MGTRRTREGRPAALAHVVGRAWVARVPAALLAASALVAGCGAPRIDPPVATVPPEAPEVAAAPGDPADDPQLDALDLPEAAAGAEPAGGVGPRLDRLPALADALLAELGPGAEACAIEARYGLAARVPTDTSPAEWRLRDDGTLLPVQAQASLACDTTFPLDGPDYAAPARLAAGALERLPGATVVAATLQPDPDWGLVWRVEVQRGGASASVVADPSGAVVAVTP
jgi:hypothetical protein